MDAYYFNEEHNQFRQSLRQFLQKEVIPNIDQWEEQQRIPKELWKKFGEMGYMGLNFPEKYGGMDLDFFFSVVFIEEIAKCQSGGFAITPTVMQYMSCPYILHAGSDFLKEKYLQGVINGELVSCIGISEPGAGSDAANIQTKAIREGDFYRVNGSKTFITNGVYGDFIVTVVKTDPDAGVGGVSLLIIDRNAEGVSANKLKKLGWHASDTAELHFDDVMVPVENRIGEEGKGFYYLMQGLQLERLAGALLGIGAMEEAMKYTLNYMSERKAFGRPINKFQVLRHRMANLASELESVKYFVYHVCRMHNDGHYAVKESSMAKLLASELSDKLATQCLQMFGGYGYMEEYKMARMFRDSRIGTIGGGTSEIMREIISKIIIDDTRYQSAFDEGAASNGNKKTPTAKEIILSLDQRFRAEKAADFSGSFNFNIQGDNGGQFIVNIFNGTCKIVEGSDQEALCTVEVEDTVYEAVELGKMNPQEALATGKLNVSNLGAMLQFGGFFKRLK